MKIVTLGSTPIAGVALALGPGLAIPGVIAGPGPDFWRNQEMTPSAATVAPAAPMSHANAACTDARIVSVKETKFLQANGRDPMRAVEVGKKATGTARYMETEGGLVGQAFRFQT